jgi:spore germination protein GerM
MSRSKLILAAVLFAVLAALVFFFFRTRVRENLRGAPPATTSTAAEEPAAVGEAAVLKTVTLFFPREEDGLLVPEEREIPADPSPSREAEEALAELIKGPRGELVPALPPETKLSRVFITRNGTAYADFSRELTEKHPSGTDAELSTVYSIVDTLAYNFPSIKKVFLLIDGEERETLAGHLSLDLAYLPDYNLTVRR